MSTPSLELGALFLAHFPEHDPSGHEQEGPRPAVLVGLPTSAGRPRYPVLMLAPVTTYKGQDWAAAAPGLYPVLEAGTGGLKAPSLVLIDQTRALDAGRLLRYLGILPPTEFEPIRQALKLTFNL